MARRFNLYLLSAFILTIFCRSSVAAVNRWTSHGPEGAGLISSIVVDPLNDSVLYAATLGGVYKSESAGQQWSSVNNGLWDLAVSALAFSSEDQATLYAGTNSGTIFMTTDGGQRWIELGKPVANKINRIVATSPMIFAATPEGLFRSSDEGTTWEAVAPELRNSYIWFVAISPTGDLYAGTSQGAFESRDGGNNWRRIYFGPGYAIEFGRDGSIYLAFGRGVIKSSDRGQTWQFAFEMPGYPVTALHLSDSGRWYAGTTSGLYEFENGKLVQGNSLQGRGVAAVAASRTSPRKFAGTLDRGIFSKIENSSDWTQANRGINTLAHTNDVATFPFEPSKIFAATTNGVFKTADSAHSWQKLTTARETANDVEISPMSNIVYANEGKYLQKSLDEGTTWKTINPNFTSGLAVARSDPSTVYAALVAGMAKSSDGGDTWSYVMNDMPLGYYAWYYGFNAFDVAVHPSDPSTVYVAQEAGFFKTINGGARWSAIQHGVALAVAIDPSEPSVVYASLGGGGVVKSQDGGATWSSKTLPDQSVNTLVINPSAPSIIYAGTERGAVYRSADGGLEWQRFGNLLLGAVKRLSMDSSGNHLYAATTAGVFGYQIAEIQIFPEGGDSSRLTRLLGELLEPGHGGPPGPGFVIPVVGLGAGANGTFFKTDLVLQNHRSTDQDIVLIFLAQGNSSGGGSFFRLTLSPFDEQEINIPDIVDRLGVSGLGSLVVMGVDRSGEFDGDASIDGSSRICTQSPDRPLICQSVGAVRVDLLAGHDSAHAGALRHDARFRTNVGITNLSSDGRRFTVTVSGERHSDAFEIFVPPFSLLQTPIPGGDYGTLTVRVSTGSASAPWVFYGSSVDNRSGASWTSVGIP